MSESYKILKIKEWLFEKRQILSSVSISGVGPVSISGFAPAIYLKSKYSEKRIDQKYYQIITNDKL